MPGLVGVGQGREFVQGLPPCAARVGRRAPSLMADTAESRACDGARGSDRYFSQLTGRLGLVGEIGCVFDLGADAPEAHGALG